MLIMQDDVRKDLKLSKLCGDGTDENDGSQVHTLKEAKTDELPPAKRRPLANTNGKVSIHPHRWL